MDTQVNLSLYAVTFTQDGTVRVVVLHARDEADARYCISEGWGTKLIDVHVAPIEMEVGVMLTVYEQERQS